MVRIFLLILTLLFAVYVGFDAYTITTLGIANDIPQLTGDGGGGMAFAFLLAIGAGVAVKFQRIASAIFILAAIVSLWVGLLYQDSLTMFWSLGAAILVAIHIAMYLGTARAKSNQLPVNRTRTKDANY